MKNLIRISLNKLKKYSKSLVDYLAIFIAVISLLYSILSFNSANNQFKENAQSSDSLFNIQLTNEKELNEKLIAEITKLQEITNNQLIIIQNLLEVSESTLENKKYSERPILTFGKCILKDGDDIIDGMFAPLIELKYQNQGKRSAFSITIRPYIISSEMKLLKAGLSKNIGSSLEPGGSSEIEYKPKFNIKYKDNFYYCIEIQYFDNLLSRKFNYTLYTNYYNSRNKFEFYNCDENKRKELKSVINDYLSSSGQIELIN